MLQMRFVKENYRWWVVVEIPYRQRALAGGGVGSVRGRT